MTNKPSVAGYAYFTIVAYVVSILVTMINKKSIYQSQSSFTHGFLAYRIHQSIKFRTSILHPLLTLKIYNMVWMLRVNDMQFISRPI